MKKLISYFLIFILLVSSPMQIFAQEISYKPAITFEYEYYQPGVTNQDEFISKLRADLDNDFETVSRATATYRNDNVAYTGYHPTDLDYYNSFGSKAQVKEAYNDFLYFNANPKESPYYAETALLSGNGVTEDNVLHILNRIEILTKDIKSLLKNNPAPERANAGKMIRMAPVIVLLIILGFEGLGFTESVIANIKLSEGIAVLEGSAKLSLLGKLKIFGFLVAFTAADIWLTDYIAREAQNYDERLGELVDIAGFHRVIVDSVGNGGLFAAAKQVSGADRDARQLLHDTRFYRCFHYWEPWFKIEQLDKKIAEAKAIADFYESGKIDYTPEFRKLIAGTLIMAYGTNQEGLPEMTDANRELVWRFVYNQNEYAMQLVREELLRIYYALRFIRAELSDKTDPLRYERANIDLATTYKIMFVQKIDNRFIKFKDQSEQTLFTDALANNRGIEHDVFYEDNPYYQEYEHIDYLEPRVMDNIQYQGLDQRRYINHELSSNRQIMTDIGFDLLNGTNTDDTYPTLLSRAQVNFLAQLIGIKLFTEEKALQDWVNSEIERKERSNRKTTDFSYLEGTNLTEGQKRMVMSNCGTK